MFRATMSNKCTRMFIYYTAWSRAILATFQDDSAQFCFSIPLPSASWFDARLPPVVPPSDPAGIYFAAANTVFNKDESANLNSRIQVQTDRVSHYNVKRTVFRFVDYPRFLLVILIRN